jgi:hypothetical protein
MDHLSFNVADEDALHQLRARLLAAGSEVTGVVDHNPVPAIGEMAAGNLESVPTTSLV